MRSHQYVSQFFLYLFLLPSISFLLQHGVIVADEEEYFIEPLSPGANVSTGSEGKGSPHVVYKRSSLQYPHMDAACGVLGIYPTNTSFIHPSAGWKTPSRPGSKGLHCSRWQRTKFISCIQESFLYLFLPMLRISGALVFGKLLYALLCNRAFKFVNRAWNRREKKLLLIVLKKNPPRFGQFTRY